jgi:surfeit locus 1 family protein
MIIGKRHFKPAWWSLAFTLCAMALFIALGLWQLDRATLKEAIEARFQQRLTEDYRPWSATQVAEDIEYRKLLLQGRYDNEHSLLVDNQLHRGRAGYYILTPLQLRDSDRVVLVNRGWAAWGESRDHPAPIATPSNAQGVAGIAYFPSEPALAMGGVQLTEGWPQLIPYVDIDALQVPFGNRLLPWVLWLAPEQPGAYVRDWKPVWMRPEKSRAYATQWFAFAALALIFFIILNLRKVE